jgi:hypothetical protein
MSTQTEANTPGFTAPAGIDSTMARRGRLALTLQEQLFLFCSLMLITSCFLPWRNTGTDQSLWDTVSALFPNIISLACLFLLAIWCITPFTVALPQIRPWFGIATAISVTVALVGFAILPGTPAYGTKLAKLFALALLVLSANPVILKAGDFAMRRLNSQSAEVFTHWGTVLPGVQFSAQDLYAKVDDEIRAREWPGVELLRAAYSEAGLLSHKREYLRVIRQRQVFDLCAGSFGKDYFITLREAEIRAQLTLATLLIFLVVLFMVLSFCLSTFGSMLGLVSFGVLLVGGVLLLLNVLRMGLTRLDGLLMRTPVVGPIYETWFRRSTTYFQYDTRVVFLKLMDDLVKARVDEEMSAKGVKLLSCFEHQPILDGLYKTSTRTPKGAK